jgi:tRNA threonylcarbamoyl adenosine modification protein YjeE
LLDLVTNTPAETESAGERFGHELRQGDLILIEGDLGAGKTTFVRGVARGAGSTAHVASPTFQLVRVYPGRVQVAHVDLYRVEASSELGELGLEELLDQGAVVVEWGNRLDAPESASLSIEHLGGDRRRLRMQRDLTR